MLKMEPRQLIETYGQLVEQEIRKGFLEFSLTIPLYPMAEYHLGWRDQNFKPCEAPQGKMLRPLLCLLSYQVFDEEIERAIPLAAAAELYHNHTLVLDDIQDGDKLRRNRPTVWSLWGIGQGINTGLILGYLSQLFLLKLQEKKFPLEKIVALLQDYAKMTVELAEGQSLDLDFEARRDVTADEYLVMIGKKTGALASFCTFGGALLGQNDRDVAEKFKIFGRKLGVAMQIRDDLVGIWSDSKESGKEGAKDLLRKKKTFPILKAFDLLKEEKLEMLSKHFSSGENSSSETVRQIVALLEEEGVRDIGMAAARDLMAEALAVLRETAIPVKRLETLENFANHAYNSIGTLRQAAMKK